MHMLSKETLEALWAEFDVLIDDEENIDDDWCGFERGTSRYDVWEWFDGQYAQWGGLYALLYPYELKEVAV